MKSATLPSFWKAYESLDKPIRHRARKAYHLWAENPFHPSLHFKCINSEENIWSVRVTLGYRAVGILEENIIIWFWVGNHDDYEQFFS